MNNVVDHTAFVSNRRVICRMVNSVISTCTGSGDSSERRVNSIVFYGISFTSRSKIDSVKSSNGISVRTADVIVGDNSVVIVPKRDAITVEIFQGIIGNYVVQGRSGRLTINIDSIIAPDDGVPGNGVVRARAAGRGGGAGQTSRDHYARIGRGRTGYCGRHLYRIVRNGVKVRIIGELYHKIIGVADGYQVEIGYGNIVRSIQKKQR